MDRLVVAIVVIRATAADVARLLLTDADLAHGAHTIRRGARVSKKKRRQAIGDSPREDRSSARGSIGLLGLLHYLWEEPQLNQWRPSWR
ncbi:DUF1173 family protein [Streptomyces sp. 8K308]|uniref:DUF1173 family protein n=1 Tax=Streptomyces sp. 8K308 TaxID=2530388 RepID=UPI001404B40C|nr:DUF1173 family protein [Streptomyces sp. 8K308]